MGEGGGVNAKIAGSGSLLGPRLSPGVLLSMNFVHEILQMCYFTGKCSHLP